MILTHKSRIVSCLFLCLNLSITSLVIAFGFSESITTSIFKSKQRTYNFSQQQIKLNTKKKWRSTYILSHKFHLQASTTDNLVDIPTNEISDFTNLKESEAFSAIATLTAMSLLESERRRHELEKNSASNWLDDKYALFLKQTFDKITMKLADQRTGIDRDEAGMWIRWMKATPSPTIVELTQEFQQAANYTILQYFNNQPMEIKPIDILNRMSLRLILLPSGSELNHPIIAPSGSVIYGKLLYGGVNRYRLQTSTTSSSNKYPPRKTALKTIIKSTLDENIPAWIQYGGSPRKYEALDMGAAAILEITMQPRFTKTSDLFTDKTDMSLSRLLWNPHSMFSFITNTYTNNNHIDINDKTAISLSGIDRNQAFEKSFQSSVGGLQPQIQAIVRRVLDGRVIRPAEDDIFQQNTATSDNTAYDSTVTSISDVALEAEELALLGLSPVKGLLLYGPPGCGKTALAREISKALKARSPKIVSAPELLDRWVGGSERLVRELFAQAEAELAACNNDATKSALHVIVIDEIDAVFRTRSMADDSGESTRSSVVNQILAKLDGVNAISNVLLIGMTNRRELLDEALLRPGRLEVQIEIPLPNKAGRREILQIHFDALRKKGRLSKSLCLAIDGIQDFQKDLYQDEIIDDGETKSRKKKKRKAMKKAMNQFFDSLPQRRSVYDLADDAVTGGFSGADLAGLVRCAGSIALSRARRDGGGVEALLITLDDVKEAIVEISK